MNNRIRSAGWITLLTIGIAGTGGCQSEKPVATTRPTGSVPTAATNDQGTQATPPVIHFNQSDHN